MRKETEWVEIIKNNDGVLTANTEENILEAYKVLNKISPKFDNLYGDGNAAGFICEKLIE